MTEKIKCPCCGSEDTSYPYGCWNDVKEENKLWCRICDTEWYESKRQPVSNTDTSGDKEECINLAKQARILIDEFRTERLNYRGYCLLRDAVDYMQRYIGDCQPFSAWIPCSKQMPEPFQNVLIWVDEFKYQAIGILNDADNWWVRGVNGRGAFSELHTPTHWQPLPQPPAGKDLES